MSTNKGVGKSCLINRYIKGEFTNQYNVTVGVEYASKILAIDDKTTVRLQIWDTVEPSIHRQDRNSFVQWSDRSIEESRLFIYYMPSITPKASRNSSAG